MVIPLCALYPLLMRQGMANPLLVLFAGFYAASSGPEAKSPARCRRHGKPQVDAPHLKFPVSGSSVNSPQHAMVYREGATPS